MNEKVKIAIERLKAYEPPEGYWLAYSGGKDSDTCKALCDMAGVKYEAHYRITSVDPPELYNYIRNTHPDVHRDIPHDKDGTPISMWNLIPRRMMPPTRIARYCCAELKEDSGEGRMTITGVRWAESVSRKRNQGIVLIRGGKTTDRQQALATGDFRETSKTGIVLVNDNADSRRMVERCYARGKTTLNPIIDWTDRDVWIFLRGEGVPVCQLYNEGFTRLGCIGCPMASTQLRTRGFYRWPQYQRLYMDAFDRMLKVRRERNNPFQFKGKPHWDVTAQDVFDWWMEFDKAVGQLSFEDVI